MESAVSSSDVTSRVRTRWLSSVTGSSASSASLTGLFVSRGRLVRATKGQLGNDIPGRTG